MQRPHEIFAPPPPPEPAPEPIIRNTRTYPAEDYTTPTPYTVTISRTTNTTASLFDVAEPDRGEIKPEAKDEPKQPSHCEICGSSVDDLGDILQLEAPREFLALHMAEDDKTPVLKFWHRKCFEAHYKLKLPEFPMDGAPAEPKQVSRRIIIKDNPGAQHAVR